LSKLRGFHEETTSALRGRLEAKTPDDPVTVVPMRKVFQSVIEFVDGCESFEPKQLLLECSNKSFNTAIAFGTSDKGRTRWNAKEFQLVLKYMRNELTCVIVPRRRTTRGVAVVHFARRTNRLLNCIDRFMTRATLSGPRSQTFPSAMIDDDKDRCVSLISHARRAIDRPHLVGPGCHNLSIMHM